ncbi:MAG TPA: hypothetical protein HA272_01745 [Methanoregula sp.]|nr:hypothetical protein [Methanoregula sp.]
MSSPFNDSTSCLPRAILLLILAGTAALLIPPISADSAITITAPGDQSYYLGETVVFTGTNDETDATYLFLMGPNLPKEGAQLTSPYNPVTSGDPGSFATAATRPDNTWEYPFLTDNLGIGPGTYTLYAVTRPAAKDQLTGGSFATISIILKRPFVTAWISPQSIIKGQPSTVTGSADGDPGEVQLWIIGYDYAYTETTTVDPDSSYRFILNSQTTEKISKGPCSVIVQHPMQNNQFDVVVSGDFVKNLQINEGNGTGGMNLFRIRGAGSLRGSDTTDALINAINDPSVDDTYTLIQTEVDDTGVSAFPAPTATTRPAPLHYAPFAALVLIMGIALWSRR